MKIGTDHGIYTLWYSCCYSESLQKYCFKLAHSGHQGIVKTKNLIHAVQYLVEWQILNTVYTARGFLYAYI